MTVALFIYKVSQFDGIIGTAWVNM